MKQGIHPDYVECTVKCTCGNTFTTRSTKSELRVDICNACHPFFTGQQKFIDTGGRVQRFADKFGSAKDMVAEREAAKKANAKIVGVDVDQAPIIDALANEDTTITSAMKGLASSTKAALKGIIEDGKWDELAGKIDNLGLVSGTDMDANYVGIPTGDGTAWCDTFTTDDYAALVAAMFDGTITVSNDITKKPADFATDITLTDLGTLN